MCVCGVFFLCVYVCLCVFVCERVGVLAVSACMSMCARTRACTRLSFCFLSDLLLSSCGDSGGEGDLVLWNDGRKTPFLTAYHEKFLFLSTGFLLKLK